MKGPIIQYNCGECENLQFMHYWYHCLGMGEILHPPVNGKDNVHSINLDKNTPEWCPFLNKTKRKEKLNNLNE